MFKDWVNDRREEIAAMGLLKWLTYALIMVAFVVLSLPFILIASFFEALNDWTKTWFGGVVDL